MSDCRYVEERIVDHLDRSLAESEAAEVRAHVEACPACSEMERSYRAMQQAYRALPEADVSEGLAQELREAAREEREDEVVRPVSPEGTSGTPFYRGLLVAAAAVLLILFVPILLDGFGGSAEPEFTFAELMREGDRKRDEGSTFLARIAFQAALSQAVEEADVAAALESLAMVDMIESKPLLALERLEDLRSRAPSLAESEPVLLLRVLVLEALGDAEQARHVRDRLAGQVPNVQELLNRTQQGLRPKPDPDLDEETLELLQALGYIGD